MTAAELAAVTDERSGGWCWNWPDVKATVAHAQSIGSALRWWAHDEDEAPRAWPVVAPKDGAL